MINNKINLGIIGYGYWGPNLVRVFNELDLCKVKYVCDLKPENLTKARQKHAHIKPTNDYHSVINDPEIDAVVISTPVSTHYGMAKEALLRNKHVFIEKPMARSSAEASELIQLAAANKKILMIGHTFLYSPPVQKVKELIDNNVLGNIYYIDSSRVNLGLFQPDVSVIWDLGPHDISIVLSWLEEDPIAVHTAGNSYIQKNIEELAYITLKFKSGVVVHIHISWLAPCKLRRTAIVGSKSMVVYDDTESVEKVKIYDQGVIKNPEDFGEFQLTYRSGNIVSPRVGTEEPLKLECMDFLSSIISGKEPKSDGKFGLKVVKVLEAAQKSISNSGSFINIE